MELDAGSYSIHIQSDANNLALLIDLDQYSKLFVLCDENTLDLCLPKLQINKPFHLIQIPSGEKWKNLETSQIIWKELMANGADRHSLLINLGGGVIGDMGGFAASTYMRGIDFVQIPTTLLSQVDASIGGKLGIDFEENKNIIGLFKDPKLVLINSDFLETLPQKELLSGFAEIIKHALIQDAGLWEMIQSVDLNMYSEWPSLISRAILVKHQIVKKDPFEKGLRKILNFGHSVGHAIESEFLKSDTPISHGHGVAIGMICEAHIAWQKGLLSDPELAAITVFINKSYTKINLPTTSKLLDRMGVDKKNLAGQKRIATINHIGNCLYDIHCTNEEVKLSFHYYSES